MLWQIAQTAVVSLVDGLTQHEVILHGRRLRVVCAGD
jgi:hypothetical protein